MNEMKRILLDHAKLLQTECAKAADEKRNDDFDFLSMRLSNIADSYAGLVTAEKQLDTDKNMNSLLKLLEHLGEGDD